MPQGKPAGVRCVNLSDENHCTIHSDDNFPKVCRNLTPSGEMCGETYEYALEYLQRLEILTTPEKESHRVTK
jgi:hypothetical protein